MTTVFVSGSIGIKKLDDNVQNRLLNILKPEFKILIGDADGIDSAVQNFLKTQTAKNVIVYCSGEKPRNNLNDWPVRLVDTKFKAGTKSFFTAKDIQMADDAEFGLMIWDSKSTGTLKNIIELLSRGKKSVVYIYNIKKFIQITNVNEFEQLITFMTESASAVANEKLDLKNKIYSLKTEQLPLL